MQRGAGAMHPSLNGHKDSQGREENKKSGGMRKNCSKTKETKQNNTWSLIDTTRQD